jgi:hypothetical protein
MLPCDACPCPDICLAPEHPQFAFLCDWAASGDPARRMHVTERSRFGYTPPAKSDEPAPVAVAGGEPETATLVSETLGTPPLAGDLVEGLAKRIGADRAAKWIAAKLGAEDCGCEWRRQALNRVDAAVRKFLGW